jgi:hypothetical protein
MKRTEQSDRVSDYILNMNSTSQYGHNICGPPPTGLHCKTTNEQSTVIDIETSLRNGTQSVAVTPKVNQTCQPPIVKSFARSGISEWDLRESKTCKTISKLENNRWQQPVPVESLNSSIWEVNDILGVDSRNLIKYSNKHKSSN